MRSESVVPGYEDTSFGPEPNAGGVTDDTDPQRPESHRATSEFPPEP